MKWQSIGSTRIATKRWNRLAKQRIQITGSSTGRIAGHRLLFKALVLAVAMLAAPAQAAITFSFNYTDVGVGFNDATFGAARRASLEQTGTLLSNIFPSYTATITMDVDGSNTEDSTLAAAGSNYNSATASTCAAGYNRGDVGTKILGGVDPAPGMADGTVTVNFQDVMWDLDDSVDGALFDFKSTMLHELLHAAGFSASIMPNGTDGCTQAAPTAGGWNPFDQHLGNTTKNFINASFVIDTAAWNAAVTGGAGNAGVLWRGSNGVAANAGNPIPIFSPNPYQEGSSISHMDDDFYTATALLMEAATGAGPGVRTLAAIELGIMQDIGFIQTTPPPPPPPPPPAPSATTVLTAIINFLLDDE